MKFDKLVQTVLNEYDEQPVMVWYYKRDPHTNEYKHQALYDYDDPPSKEEGWIRMTPAEAVKFVREKGKMKKQ